MDGKLVAGLIAVIFIVLGGGTYYFYPYFSETDVCRVGTAYGSWESITEEVYFNASFPRIARYFCDLETDMTQLDCLKQDKFVNADGCKWGGKTSKRNANGLQTILYVMVDPEIAGVEKTYDTSAKTVTIFNKISGGEIAKVALSTPLVNYVFYGKDRLVAEFTIENKDKPKTFGDILTNMEFFDKERSDVKINRTVWYKWKEVKIDVVPNLVEECVLDTKANNGSKICTMNGSGTKKIYTDVWRSINGDDEVPLGNLTVGVFTDVLPKDNVEWIPTMFGARINEWGSWQDGFTKGLVMYYDFEDGTGSKATNRVSPAVYNISVGGNWSTTALIGSFAYNTTDTPSNTFWTGYANTDQLTINLWVYRTGNWGTTNHFLWDNEDTVTWAHARDNSDNAIRTLSVDGAGAHYNDMSEIPLNNWTMITFTMSTTSALLYSDASPDSAEALDGTGLGGASPYPLMLFCKSVAPLNDCAENVIIDEVGVWNRTLNASDILLLYNDGAGMTFPPSNYAPVITPSINTTAIFGFTWINASAVYSDAESGLGTVYFNLTVNGTYVSQFTQTSIASGKSVSYIIDPANYSFGDALSFKWKAYDGAVYGSNSTNITVSEYRPSPTVTMVLPATNINVLNGSSFNVQVNISTSDANYDPTTFVVYPDPS